MKRIQYIFHVHLMGEWIINDNPLFFSVNSVFSVANCFLQVQWTVPSIKDRLRQFVGFP